MIVKFLYQMNVVNKRIITGLVEDDKDITYDAFREIPMELESKVVLNEGERKVSNFGDLYYGVFREGDTYKYVNLNDYMLKVKVDASSIVQYATPLTKDMLNSILYNTNYLDCDLKLEYISAGYTLGLDKEYDDKYRSVFKKVEDDSYVEFEDSEGLSFLAKNNNIVDVVFDFKDATKIYKKELRPLLLTHKFLGSSAYHKSNVYMSHYNIFKNFDTNEYLFAGDNSFKVLYNETTISFVKNPELVSPFRLINDESRNLVLRDILNILKHQDKRGKHIVKIKDKYLKNINDYTYELSDNAADASLIDDFMIDIIKDIVKLYSEDTKVFVLSDTTGEYFIYSNESKYEISQNRLNMKSNLIRSEVVSSFIDSFNNFASDGNTILILNDKYVKINFESNYKFEIEYLNSGYNASKFNASQVKALESVIGVKFAKRELNKIIDNTNHLNIDYNEVKPLAKSYQEFLSAKANSKIKFAAYKKDLSTLKVGSDKASFEYLESLYVKSVIDSKNVVDKVISKVKNILVVGSIVTLDLYGIALSAKEKNKLVNVSMLDTTKWGYYPNVSLGSNVSFDGTYRLELESVTKDFINQFDLILISKKYNANNIGLLDLIDNLCKDSYKGIIINLSYTNTLNLESNVSSILKSRTTFKKYLPRFDVEELTNIYGTTPLLDNNISYFSIFKIRDNLLVDAIKSK